jgi:hypothetical protein
VSSRVTKLPMSKAPPAVNRLRAFNKFTSDADRIADRCKELRRLSRDVDQATPVRSEHDRKILAYCEQRAALSEHEREVLARCDQALDAFNPDDFYDEDGLRVDVISLRLATLIGAFPNAAPGDAQVYVASLIEQIEAVEDLNFLALDAACSEIVATQKFLPAISEVLTVVNEQNEKWQDRMWSICDLADLSRGLVARIASQNVND